MKQKHFEHAHKDITEIVAEQKVTTPVSHAYHFRPNKSGCWFYFIWTPGVVILTGDPGSIVFTHPSAFSSFEYAMDWMSSESDAGYKLSKTDKCQVIDVDSTIENLEEQLERAEDFGFDTEEEQARLRELIDDIADCESDPAQVPALIYDSGLLDDYYGSYSYSYRDRLLLKFAEEAARNIQQPARMCFIDGR